MRDSPGRPEEVHQPANVAGVGELITLPTVKLKALPAGVYDIVAERRWLVVEEGNYKFRSEFTVRRVQ